MDSSDTNEERQEVVAPLEQQTLQFYGKSIVVVRLPDDRPAVVLGYLCDNLQINTYAQIKRIRRTEAIVDDLVHVRVERKPEEGGSQAMAALLLHSVPFWLAGIDAKRVSEEIRPDLIRYQREVVDVLYAWAQAQKVLPQQAKNLVPSEPIPQPTRPDQDAPVEEWIEYHTQMAELLKWRRDVEQWQGSIETRLEGVEAMTGLIPEILERLGPQTLTPEHHRRVQTLAQQLQQATGKPHATIYNELKTVFEKPRIQDLLEDEWAQVENWFHVQIERAKTTGKQKKGIEQQPKLPWDETEEG